ncbi:MAG: hypothetical protein AB7Q29_05725 [Vicinamibacterales bacterium]
MTWKRLEGSGVSADLTRGLQARIADPLWLLARQWQVGEFGGEDAASPVEVRARALFDRVGEVRLTKGAVHPIAEEHAPLEARVECEPVWSGPAALRQSAEAGLQLLRMADAAGVGPQARTRLQRTFPLRLAEDDGLDPRGRRELELLAWRSFDAAALVAAIRRGAAPDPAIAGIVRQWLASQAALFLEPGGARPEAWNPERMEYRLEVAAPSFASGTRLEAREYPGGHLDWSAFDVKSAQPPSLERGSLERRIATVPVPLTYAGMPEARWWTFEDGAVYWGDIQGGPEDLARFLVASFATLYSDDWHLVPLEFPRGSLAIVMAVEIRDSFGRVHAVPSTAAADYARLGDARPFRWFELAGDPAPANGWAPRLLLPAALPQHEEGPPIEEVLLLRDEPANLAWAVERTIESPAGRPVSRVRESVADVPPTAEPGAWAYDLSTSVPSWFVPLVPVRTDGASPAMRFQRGRMATTGGSVGARARLLEPDRRLLIHEEEVPASGVRVTRAFQMCRGVDGAVYVWAGRRKQPARVPQTTGLAHDVLTITETP